ncbi:MAG: hypothetical protein GX928_01120 [Ruminococcaceae bacterium]|nr:hypothetical protein [Oscillospiraceae bacterium]
MIDLHTHVLYGVDDGAQNTEESIEMLRMYTESGYTDIVITPHHDPNRYEVSAKTVQDGVILLERLLERTSLELNIFPGHEIQLQAKTVEMLKEGVVLPLNDSRYVLIELPFRNKPYYARELLYRIQLEGFVPFFLGQEYVESSACSTFCLH